jgi:Domain of unknown function (DUF4217)
MKDKEVFRFSELKTDKLALSLGLANAPQVIKKSSSDAKNAQRDTNEGDDEEGEKQPKLSRL